MRRLHPSSSFRSGPAGDRQVRQHSTTTDLAGQAASSACRHHRPVWEPARSRSVRAAWNSREGGVGVPFARFGRPLSWRIACSDSNGRGPAGLPARPAAFTTDGADAHPPHAVSPTALEELWSKRDRRLTSFVALRARITGSSRLTAAFRRASPRGASRRGINPLGQTRVRAAP
jgi:hypothetical protein